MTDHGVYFDDFFRKFGHGLRTKNIQNLIDILKTREISNKRNFILPQGEFIPQDFIRLDPWEAEYLFMLAHLSKETILEIGRYSGGSTFLLGCANRNSKIISIDISPQDDDILQNLLIENDIGHNIEIITADSSLYAKEFSEDLGLLFIDGDHSYDGCYNDFKNYYGLVSSGGHIVFHDCYFGSEVQLAVIDIMRKFDIRPICGPYIPTHHWFFPTGSLAHFVKPES